MQIISGMLARRVSIPRTMKTAQKTSANTVKPKEILDPTPNGSEKECILAEKLISFGHPCKNISPPKTIRTINMEKLTAPFEYPVEKSFLILDKVFCALRAFFSQDKGIAYA
ncbi:hypothetical protein J2T02_004471 [Chitinophaga terrae (ex Kim and Jung 2007)]|nr:hypothetical protein [Chitinophaga terrae (ex Kim and Jung 2007)]